METKKTAAKALAVTLSVILVMALAVRVAHALPPIIDII